MTAAADPFHGPARAVGLARSVPRTWARVAACAATLVAVLVAVSMSALLTVGLATPAQAHSQLVRSTPADGALLAAPPSSVELVFNEDINPNFAQLIIRGPDGTALGITAPAVTGPGVTTSLPQPTTSLPAGTYVVAYRVTSADGHPIAGQVSFTVTGVSPAPGGAAGPGGASPSLSAPSVGTPSATAPGATSGGSSVAPTATTVTSLASTAATSDAGNAALYLLTGAGALGLILLGGLVLRSERRFAPRA